MMMMIGKVQVQKDAQNCCEIKEPADRKIM